jgi:hypothetical protein
MRKTDANPQGAPMETFDGLRAGLTAHRDHLNAALPAFLKSWAPPRGRRVAIPSRVGRGGLATARI